MARIEINSAYSAQPSTAKPNPFVEVAIRHCLENGLLSRDSNKPRIADQGCGKLRHLTILCRYFDTIYLIDKEFQLNLSQRLFDLDGTSIKEYISSLKMSGKKFNVLSSLDFDSSKLNLDIVFNICVFDVEVPKIRKAMIAAAYKNLKEGGLYVVIIPRNDQSILVRCTTKNRYLDGHVFQHRGVVTFYKNYRNTRSLIYAFAKESFVLEADLSVYRQVCLILRKMDG
jgi:hypothetical protein